MFNLIVVFVYVNFPHSQMKILIRWVVNGKAFVGSITTADYGCHLVGCQRHLLANDIAEAFLATDAFLGVIELLIV